MMKLTAVAAAALLLVGGAAFGATEPAELTASRSDVASAVTSSCSVSREGCLATIRTWMEAAATCREQDIPTEDCVCSRENLDIARGLGDAALNIKASDADLFGLVASAINDGAPDCFASAFAEILAGDDDDVGSPG